jgi:hypothetical protein
VRTRSGERLARANQHSFRQRRLANEPLNETRLAHASLATEQEHAPMTPRGLLMQPLERVQVNLALQQLHCCDPTLW